MKNNTRKRLKEYLELENSITLGQRLKLFRVYHELTQQQVAKILNVERSTYAYYELGKTRISIENLLILSRVYNVSLDFLVKNT